MYGVKELLVLLCLVALCSAATVVYVKKEGFMDPVCPDKAVRETNGAIRAGGKLFKSLEEYTSYMRDLYAQGAQCIPPRVEDGPLSSTQEVPPYTFFGGFGGNRDSPDAVGQQGTTREVLNQTNDEYASTSAKTPIKKLDDYEYTRVFKTESQLRNGLTPETKNDMLAKHVEKLLAPYLPALAPHLPALAPHLPALAPHLPAAGSPPPGLGG